MLDPALAAWVEKVIADTQSRQISWKSVNPTTYLWETSPPRPARVVLQRVERVEVLQATAIRPSQRKTITTLLLQAFDLSKPQAPVVATLNGADDPETNDALKVMYETVARVATKETLEFLNSLLPKPSRRDEPIEKWFFVIAGTENRQVHTSDAIYDTEAEAQSAGTEYLKNNKAIVMRATDPNEVFTVMSGRQ